MAEKIFNVTKAGGRISMLFLMTGIQKMVA
jgi:hypothetical protein